jgi:hypothetical protein
MNAVGVDACVLSVSPSYRTEVRQECRATTTATRRRSLRFPGRISSGARYHALNPDLPEPANSVLERPGSPGLRTTVWCPEHWKEWETGGHEHLVALCERHGVPPEAGRPGLPGEGGRGRPEPIPIST